MVWFRLVTIIFLIQFWLLLLKYGSFRMLICIFSILLLNLISKTTCFLSFKTIIVEGGVECEFHKGDEKLIQIRLIKSDTIFQLEIDSQIFLQNLFKLKGWTLGFGEIEPYLEFYYYYGTGEQNYYEYYLPKFSKEHKELYMQK